MSKIKLSLSRTSRPQKKVVNPGEPRKDLTDKEKKIIERASLVFSVCTLKGSDRIVFKLRPKPGFSQAHIECIVPYTDEELLNKRDPRGNAHIQTIRKDRLEPLKQVPQYLIAELGDLIHNI